MLLQEQWCIEGAAEVCEDCGNAITDASLKMDAHIAEIRCGIRKRFVPNLYAKLRQRRKEPK
jgi:hypothetical protein